MRLYAKPTALPPQNTPILLESPLQIDVYDYQSQNILRMDLEQYIAHVVGAEMPDSFELEALKCQAIAARTFTIHKMKLYGGGGCEYGGDVCTSSRHCQAYSSGPPSDNIRMAVSETVGLIVTYKGRPIEALYHSTSGGMTEDSENVFAHSLPYLRSVVSDETDAPYYTDTVTLTNREFVATVNAANKNARLNADELQGGVAVLSRTAAGRINSIRLGKAVITGKELRQIFALRSTNVEFTFSGSSVTMLTHGFGHGVGMSQTGANSMAKEGMTFEKILKHYYTDTDITDIEDVYQLYK